VTTANDRFSWRTFELSSFSLPFSSSIISVRQRTNLSRFWGVPFRWRITFLPPLCDIAGRKAFLSLGCVRRLNDVRLKKSAVLAIHFCCFPFRHPPCVSRVIWNLSFFGRES
jgi:hypothetical protein